MLKLFEKKRFVLLAVFFMLEVSLSLAKKPLELPIHPIPLEIQTNQGTVSYKVEIAFTLSQAAAGLMYRTDFPRDRAMLFRNQASNQLKDKQEFFMWMANTPLPLDIIFLNSEGIIVSIVEKTSPFSTDTISSGIPATFALEINAGEVSEKQIKKGQRVLHPALFGKYEGDKK
ncbi:DUF192 domain-containing protein [Bartonella quintana]|uniref:DUF192 domain-containing protein n=2 Tax=Bartonella quintana TaxID=803 RepID=A0A0H3LU48_BARQU|nr:DUF192 domain-containing protein [Bartonella quintana]ETS14295.1 hypothetical protein Q650_00927 [Bartonella quintana JK 73rel]ETS15982.1 hypothetical protein Q649_00936 [Bartonella quintana JK 73]KEC60198.1 hypothetical protein O93_00335 [Bartonella quintana JK 19]QUG71878.1 DUF192 domain-containing protein [Bartonella quintana]CAF26118.1 hypothetical protein BQ06270 [Bartonella quintana str. Toulouse]